MDDSIRTTAKTISILAIFLLAVSPLYDPEVLSKLLHASSEFGLLPYFIDEEITGTKKYIDSKDGVGLEYTGKWKNGKFHGEGTYFTLNGTYVCQWRNGQKHGEGTYIDSGGKQYIEVWEKGKRISKSLK